jgi:glutathione S-transferase
MTATTSSEPGDLILYGDKMATCTMRVQLVLSILGIPYEYVHVDLSKGEQKSLAHRARQPFGKVPALEDKTNGAVLFESRCLMRYIAEKYGASLFGNGDAKLKALIDNWMEVEATTYSTPVSSIVYEKVFKSMFNMGDPDVDRINASLAELDKILDVYDQELQSRKFLVGDALSLADLSHIPYTLYLIKLAGVEEPFSTRPNVWRWWQELSEVAEEHLDPV